MHFPPLRAVTCFLLLCLSAMCLADVETGRQTPEQDENAIVDGTVTEFGDDVALDGDAHTTEAHSVLRYRQLASSATSTRSKTKTPTPSRAPSPSKTRSRSLTPTRTRTKSITPTKTRTISVSPTKGSSPTRTPSNTRSRTKTSTASRSKTPSISRSKSKSPAPGSSVSPTPSSDGVSDSSTKTPTKSLTSSRSPSKGSSVSPSPASESKTSSKSRSSSRTPSTGSSRTGTPTRSSTKSPSTSRSATKGSSPSPSPASESKTASKSRSSSRSPSSGSLAAETPTKTPSKSRSSSKTPTLSVSASVGAVPSASSTKSISKTRSFSKTVSLTRSASKGAAPTDSSADGSSSDGTSSDSFDGSNSSSDGGSNSLDSGFGDSGSGTGGDASPDPSPVQSSTSTTSSAPSQSGLVVIPSSSPSASTSLPPASASHSLSSSVNVSTSRSPGSAAIVGSASSGASTTTIIGVVVGATVGLSFCAMAACLVMRRSRSKRTSYQLPKQKPSLIAKSKANPSPKSNSTSSSTKEAVETGVKDVPLPLPGAKTAMNQVKGTEDGRSDSDTDDAEEERNIIAKRRLLPSSVSGSLGSDKSGKKLFDLGVVPSDSWNHRQVGAVKKPESLSRRESTSGAAVDVRVEAPSVAPPSHQRKSMSPARSKRPQSVEEDKRIDVDDLTMMSVERPASDESASQTTQDKMSLRRKRGKQQSRRSSKSLATKQSAASTHLPEFTNQSPSVFSSRDDESTALVQTHGRTRSPASRQPGAKKPGRKHSSRHHDTDSHRRHHSATVASSHHHVCSKHSHASSGESSLSGESVRTPEKRHHKSPKRSKSGEHARSFAMRNLGGDTLSSAGDGTVLELQNVVRQELHRRRLSASPLRKKSSRSSWFGLDALFGLGTKSDHVKQGSDAHFPSSPMPKYASLPSHGHGGGLWPSPRPQYDTGGLTTSAEIKWMSAQRAMSQQKAAEELASATVQRHQLQTVGLLPLEVQQPSTAIVMNGGNDVPLQSFAATPGIHPVMMPPGAFSPRVPVMTQLSSPLVQHQLMSQPVFTQPPPQPLPTIQPMFHQARMVMSQPPLAQPPPQPMNVYAFHPNLVPSPTHNAPPSPVSTTAEQPKQTEAGHQTEPETPTVTPGHWVFVPQGTPTIAASAVTPSSVSKSPKAIVKRSKSSSSRGSPRKGNGAAARLGQRVV